MKINNAGHPAFSEGFHGIVQGYVDPSFNAKFRNNNGILLSSGRRERGGMQGLHLPKYLLTYLPYCVVVVVWYV